MTLLVCEQANKESLVNEDWYSNISKDETCYFKIKDALFAESKEAENSNKIELAHSIALLGHCCGMMLQAEDRKNPYKNFASWADGSRTPAPEDLRVNHFESLSESLRRIKNPTLLARINDLLWLKARPPSRIFAEEAIKNYLEIVRALLKNKSDILLASDYLTRAAKLWRQLGGANKETQSQLEELIELCMDLSSEEPKDFLRYKFYDVLPECFDHANAQKWLNLGEKLVGASLSQQAFEKARAYLGTMKEINQAIKNVTAASVLKERQTDLYVTEAREKKKAGLEPMIVQSLFNKAIDACRKTPGKTQLAKELHKELVKDQEAIPETLSKVFETTINLESQVTAVIGQIQKSTFRDALALIAGRSYPPSKAKLYENVEEILKNSPLQGIFPQNLIDEKGKLVARIPPALGTTPTEREAGIRSRAAKNLVFYIDINGTIIQWAQREINNRIDHDESVFDNLLYPNPFVPEGRFLQFKAGLIEGLKGNWMSSMAILIPQLENSLREVMHSAGYNMMILNDEGIQQEKDLNAFIYSQEFQNLVGENMAFLLQVLLAEPTGLNLRNKFAHGLVSDGIALSGATSFLWSLTLHLCMVFQNHYYSSLPEET